MSYDLPLWSVVETDATVYQKDQERFHIVLTEPRIEEFETDHPVPCADSPLGITSQLGATPRLLWLEISPYRVIMTMQGNGQFSYRHFWEQGVYGTSRYWLQTDHLGRSYQLRLQNFTRQLTLAGQQLPQHLRIEYELWSAQVQLGQYVMNLEVMN